ncbi:MAG TPA: hypothetical protein VEI07_22400 [Planctomycetaceae bacterium]|nr:hypothetical protein [Planctomycetaceae bacterium]
MRTLLDFSEALRHRLGQGERLECVLVAAVQPDTVRADGKKQKLARVGERTNEWSQMEALSDTHDFVKRLIRPRTANGFRLDQDGQSFSSIRVPNVPVLDHFPRFLQERRNVGSSHPAREQLFFRLIEQILETYGILLGIWLRTVQRHENRDTRPIFCCSQRPQITRSNRHHDHPPLKQVTSGQT